MKTDAAVDVAATARAAASGAGWRFGASVCAVLGLLALVLYADTALGLFRFWVATESYSHVYILVPLAFYFMWEQRSAAARQIPTAFAPAALWILLCSAGWLVGRLVDVRIVQELALCGAVAGIAVTVLGWRAARVFWFSGVCILLAVPIWSELIPILQDWTAVAAAGSLQMFGVPVFLEGYYLSIPNGQFVVAEVCAGLRFLLATMSIASLYAYLNLDHFGRGVLVFVIAVASSIVFNWIRVDLIILSGHLFGMDHYFVRHHIGLGWVVFGFALIPMFVAGRLLAGPLPPDAPSEPASGTEPLPPDGAAPAGASRFATVLAAALGALALASGPVLFQVIEAEREAIPTQVSLQAPAGESGWSGPFEILEGMGPRPSFAGAHGELHAAYRGEDIDAQLYLALYVRQSQGHEIVNNRSVLSSDEGWRVRQKRSRRVTLDGRAAAQVLEVTLETTVGARYLMWRWFEVAGQVVAGRYEAKFAQLRGALTGDESAVVYAVMVPIRDEKEGARRALTSFVGAMMPALVRTAKAGRAR